MPISVSVTGTGAYTTPPGKFPTGQSYTPPPTPTYIAKITYDGVDITSAVVYADAEFTSNVNGNPGACRFRVRDGAHQFDFEVGKPIELAINGLVEWTGFVSRVGRTTAFESGPASQLRFLVIEGVDINILFRKRFVFDKADPKNVSGKTYKYTGTPTKDRTALRELLNNYLDLSGDGLDTSTLVTNVADINVDQDANPFAGSWTWEQAMASINSLPAAVWYINPEKKLVWADVDTATAPFGLSDAPDNASTYGYREAEILYDGTNLVNDYYAWGAGMGEAKVVFKKLASPSSIATHGLWQASVFKTDVYKQGTIDRVASSFLNGSPSSKRGHINDKIAVTCTTFRQGLQAGMGVNFTCNAHGFSDVLPVRTMKITFPSPVTPRYDVTLSHEIDTPWSFTDVFHPKWTAPRWAPVGSIQTGCVNETFTRTVASGWGTGPLGTWASGGSYNVVSSVDGANGLYTFNVSAFDSGYSSQSVAGTGPWSSATWDMTIRVYLDSNAQFLTSFRSRWLDNNNVAQYANALTLLFSGRMKSGTYANNRYLNIYGDQYPVVSSTYNQYYGPITPASAWYFVRLRKDNNQYQAKAWLETDAEPGWQITATNTWSPVFNYGFNVGSQTQVSVSTDQSFQTKIDYINFCPTTGTTGGVIPGEMLGVYGGNGTDTISLGGPFFTGTTRVWKNGAIVRRTAYTESPSAGTITFASPTLSTDTFIVAFVGATGTNGGLTRRFI